MDERVPFFSIITPVYNRSDSIRIAIQSILDQSFADWEHVIVDDGSTDGTGEYLDGVQTKEKRIKVIHQPNQGVSAARNAGLHAAKGLYVLFLDSDDAFAPDAFSFLHDTLRKNANLDMIIFESERVESRLDNDYLLEKNEIREKFLPGLIGAEPHRPNLNYRPIVWNKCSRRFLIVENQIEFDAKKRTWEDGEFAIKMVEKSSAILLTQKEIITERTIEHNDHLSYSYYSEGAIHTLVYYNWIKEHFQKEFDLESDFFLNYHFRAIQTWIWRAMSKDPKRKAVVTSVLKHPSFIELVKKRHAEGAFEQAIKGFVSLRMFSLAYLVYWLQNLINRGECF